MNQARTALRDGQRLRRGHRAVPAQPTGVGMPAINRIASASLPGGTKWGWLRRGWSRWHSWPARAYQRLAGNPGHCGDEIQSACLKRPGCGGGEATRRELGEAEAAEEKATRELFDALVAQARANRLSRRIGQRLGTLELLRKAMGIARQLKLPPEHFLEMRNEAIAALALPDLHSRRMARTRPSSRWVWMWHSDGMRTQQGKGMSRFGTGRREGNLPAGGHWPWESRFRSQPRWRLRDCFRCRAGSGVRLETGGGRPDASLERGRGRGCFSPDSRQLAVQEPDGAISLFDLATSTTVRRLPKLPQVSCLAFHPGGRRLAVAGESFAQALRPGDRQSPLAEESRCPILPLGRLASGRHSPGGRGR